MFDDMFVGTEGTWAYEGDPDQAPPKKSGRFIVVDSVTGERLVSLDCGERLYSLKEFDDFFFYMVDIGDDFGDERD